MPLLYDKSEPALVSAICSEASGRSSGFIIASRRGREGLGFSFLVMRGDTMAALHGVGNKETPFALTVQYEPDVVSYQKFVRGYLAKAAEVVGVRSDQLVQQILTRSSLWRFVGFEDGKLSGHPDNRGFWKEIWVRLLTLASSTHIPEDGIPPEVAAELRQQLKNCAEDGQVILQP